MKTEFEAKFLNISPEEYRTLLKSKGAELIQPERIMKRYVFDIPGIKLKEGEFKWIRVRDEGDVTKLNIKHLIESGTIDEVKELEFEVSDFHLAADFLREIGMTERGYQEQKREEWRFNGVEVTIDQWPGLNPFTEIEGQTEEEVKKCAEMLGFEYADAMYGSVDYVYERELGLDPYLINRTPKITFRNFEDILPTLKKKNEKI